MMILILLYNSFVEHGKNPDIFTQGFVERAATENQFTNGKIKAVSVSIVCVFVCEYLSFNSVYYVYIGI
jgi:hypothetical protein